MTPTVIFFVPKRYVSDDDRVTYDTIQMPWVSGKSLKQYYADTRHSRHLQTMNLRCTVRKDSSREAVRTSYIPGANERFVFIPTRRSGVV